MVKQRTVLLPRFLDFCNPGVREEVTVDVVNLKEPSVDGRDGLLREKPKEIQ